MTGGPYTTCSTPRQAFSLLREILAESTAIASGAHDWDQLESLLGITLALQGLKDLELMVAERDEELARFRNRWGTP